MSPGPHAPWQGLSAPAEVEQVSHPFGLQVSTPGPQAPLQGRVAPVEGVWQEVHPLAVHVRLAAPHGPEFGQGWTAPIGVAVQGPHVPSLRQSCSPGPQGPWHDFLALRFVAMAFSAVVSVAWSEAE
jgi:hypothetical protein